MDPLTQAALGAAVGHVCAGKSLGYGRAVFWGAFAGVFPDIDGVIANALTSDPLLRLLHHRGITHSLFFAPVIGPLWGLVLWRYVREGPKVSPWPWMILIVVALWSHPLLDFCTHYGTQLLSPFSQHRFALPAIPIIEPIYTCVLIIGLLMARFFPQKRATSATLFAVILSCTYLLYGLRINRAAEEWARHDLVSQGIMTTEVYAFPTLLQLHLRRLVARTETEDWVGFVSMAEPCSVTWSHRERDISPVVEALRATPEGSIFEWFAGGLIASYHDEATVFITDLRYGFSNDVLSSNWMLEAARMDSRTRLETPRYTRNTRPVASWANITRLWGAAYPTDCQGFLDSLDAFVDS